MGTSAVLWPSSIIGGVNIEQFQAYAQGQLDNTSDPGRVSNPELTVEDNLIIDRCLDATKKTMDKSRVIQGLVAGAVAGPFVAWGMVDQAAAGGVNWVAFAGVWVLMILVFLSAFIGYGFDYSANKDNVRRRAVKDSTEHGELLRAPEFVTLNKQARIAVTFFKASLSKFDDTEVDTDTALLVQDAKQQHRLTQIELLHTKDEVTSVALTAKLADQALQLATLVCVVEHQTKLRQAHYDAVLLEQPVNLNAAAARILEYSDSILSHPTESKSVNMVKNVTA